VSANINESDRFKSMISKPTQPRKRMARESTGAAHEAFRQIVEDEHERLA
jgi:hypothetical protein